MGSHVKLSVLTVFAPSVMLVTGNGVFTRSSSLQLVSSNAGMAMSIVTAISTEPMCFCIFFIVIIF